MHNDASRAEALTLIRQRHAEILPRLRTFLAAVAEAGDTPIPTEVDVEVAECDEDGDLGMVTATVEAKIDLSDVEIKPMAGAWPVPITDLAADLLRDLDDAGVFE